MPIITVTEQQLDDARELIERGLDDMAHHEQKGDLRLDGYTDEDIAERDRLESSGAQLQVTLQQALAKAKASATLTKESAKCSALARMTLEAYSVETGQDEENGNVMDTPALRDLLIDLFHITALNDVDLNEEFDRARALWEEEVYDEQCV